MHFLPQKVAIFAEKKLQNCIINVLSSVKFKENIEIQSNSMNTLNIFRRRPCYASMECKYILAHSTVTIF